MNHYIRTAPLRRRFVSSLYLNAAISSQERNLPMIGKDELIPVAEIGTWFSGLDTLYNKR